MLVELVRTLTRDGLRLDGALAVGRRADVEVKTPSLARRVGVPKAAILLHGFGGNFYNSSTFEPLIPKLVAHGWDVLSVNTRGHDSVFSASQGTIRRRFGAAYENVEECRHDLAAWIEFLRGRGHEHVVLIGHSLGAVKAVYSQAFEKSMHVAAVVAISAPRLSYSAFMNGQESSKFFESFVTAERMVREGRGDELFSGAFPFPLLSTAQGYVHKYGPAEQYNILKFAAAIACPALFVYGERELQSGGVAFAGMTEAVAALPASATREVVTIPEADHIYTGVTDQLAERVVTWLGAHFA